MEAGFGHFLEEFNYFLNFGVIKLGALRSYEITGAGFKKQHISLSK